MKNLSGKTAFITGGASGIGLGIAKSFVAAGMNVVLADLRADHIKSAMETFENDGHSQRVHAIQLDVTDRAAMAAAAAEAERVFGNLHVIVNNAGVGIEGPLQDATYDDWDFGMAVNLGGVINGVQTFVPRIRKHGEGGHVVNTASLAALVQMPTNMAIYVTAKAAVIALTESLQSGLAEHGIGVTVLCPGPIKSNIHELEQNRPARFTPSKAFEASARNLGKRVVSSLWMEPEQVGEMIVNAVRNNALYVITHGEWRPAVLARDEAILAAMPKDTNPDLIASLRAPERKP
jgi:NAD(P)-dependent dehydrogenase (short-subunit alcohol dehydrogenase family)